MLLVLSNLFHRQVIIFNLCGPPLDGSRIVTKHRINCIWVLNLLQWQILVCRLVGRFFLRLIYCDLSERFVCLMHRKKVLLFLLDRSHFYTENLHGTVCSLFLWDKAYIKLNQTHIFWASVSINKEGQLGCRDCVHMISPQTHGRIIIPCEISTFLCWG